MFLAFKIHADYSKKVIGILPALDPFRDSPQTFG